MSETIRFQIELPVRPEWDNVELLRTSVLNCMEAMFQNYDYGHSVAMVVSELLENAVKYGDWENHPKTVFTLSVTGVTDHVIIDVTNPIQPNSPNLEVLENTVQRLRRASSPRAAYEERLQEVADQDDDFSQLGLLRIAYEGCCDINYTLNDDGVLHVTATARPDEEDTHDDGDNNVRQAS